MEVNKAKILEEKLREAACYGDEEAVITLVERNVRINSQHDINGWTPLHWACKRGHVAIVRYLLNQGADPTLTTLKGETPAMLTDNEDIRALIGDTGPAEVVPQTTLPITPHFLSHPALSDYKVDLSELSRTIRPDSDLPAKHGLPQDNGQSDYSSGQQVEEMDLVLKVRVAYLDDPDFIEVELPRTDLTFANLLRTCCDELGAEMKRVRKLRKLPNTIMRKDKEVQRLSDYQELELVLDNIQPKPAPSAAAVQTAPAVTNGAITPVMHLAGLLSGGHYNSPPGYLPNGNGSVQPSATFAKSSYCVNGTILY
uniref:Putative ankyrin repeat and dhhc-type zn-finger domain protein n=1 Tax=Ixodes ricinus TaxID=34613 RepID=A0A131Y1G2_IXORI